MLIIVFVETKKSHCWLLVFWFNDTNDVCSQAVIPHHHHTETVVCYRVSTQITVKFNNLMKSVKTGGWFPTSHTTCQGNKKKIQIESFMQTGGNVNGAEENLVTRPAVEAVVTAQHFSCIATGRRGACYQQTSVWTGELTPRLLTLPPRSSLWHHLFTERAHVGTCSYL